MGNERQAIYDLDGSIFTAIMEHSTAEARLSEMNNQLVALPPNGSALVFLQVVMMARAVQHQPGAKFVFSPDVRFFGQPADGGTAEGVLKFADDSEAPVRFLRVNNNWKIDAILTPETSVSLMNVEAADSSAVEHPDTAAPAAEESGANASPENVDKPEPQKS